MKTNNKMWMKTNNKMWFHGEKMNNVSIVEKILCFLTPKYDYVVCSIEELKDIDELLLDELLLIGAWIKDEPKFNFWWVGVERFYFYFFQF